VRVRAPPLDGRDPRVAVEIPGANRARDLTFSQEREEFRPITERGDPMRISQVYGGCFVSNVCCKGGVF